MTSIMALQEAMQEGFDEALLLDDETNISEGSGENLFLVKEGKLFTLDLAASLNGITRKSIISLAKEDGIEVKVKKISLNEILDADELFFTGTATEVVGVVSIDGEDIGSGAPGEVTNLIRDRYLKIVNGTESDYHHYLTLVS